MRTCLKAENCKSRAESRLLPRLLFLPLQSVVRDERMWRRARMWKYDALKISEASLSKAYDWSWIRDPATIMNGTGLAKATSGFVLGLERAMASDLDGLGWRPLFKSQFMWLGSKQQLAKIETRMEYTNWGTLHQILNHRKESGSDYRSRTGNGPACQQHNKKLPFPVETAAINQTNTHIGSHKDIGPFPHIESRGLLQ